MFLYVGNALMDCALVCKTSGFGQEGSIPSIHTAHKAT